MTRRKFNSNDLSSSLGLPKLVEALYEALAWSTVTGAALGYRLDEAFRRWCRCTYLRASPHRIAARLQSLSRSVRNNAVDRALGEGDGPSREDNSYQPEQPSDMPMAQPFSDNPDDIDE